jgi:hypothetical protein
MSTQSLINNTSTMSSYPLSGDLSGTINDIPAGAYSGYYYAFYGSGGFTMDQCFNTIKVRQQAAILRYDVTNSLQVTFDVRTFNSKIGLYKDVDNIVVNETSFNEVSDVFDIDTITISSTEFVDGMSESQNPP